MKQLYGNRKLKVSYSSMQLYACWAKFKMLQQHNHGWLPNMLPDPSKEEGVSKKDIHEYNKQTAEVLLDT